MGNTVVALPSNTGEHVDMSQAPGGDLSFSELFPELNVTPTTASNETIGSPQVTPQAPPVENDFLHGTTSVYKTREAAIEGVNQKDSLIEELRSELKRIAGVDPLTERERLRSVQSIGQPSVAQTVTPPAQTTTPETNYITDPDKFYDDASAAVQSGDKRKYAQVQMKFVQDLLAPYQPILQQTGQTRAIETVRNEIKDFDTFRNSDGYKQTLEKFPVFKQAIQMSESTPQGFANLPELYKLAYFASKGFNIPQLVEAANTPPAPSAPVQPVRQVMAPTTSAPVITGGGQPRYDVSTSEGRQAYMKELESKGVLNARI